MYLGFAIASLLGMMLAPGSAAPPSPLVDLEESVQEFVLETKRIVIPGYPDAFNPSLIRWQGNLLMTFRTIPDPKNSYISYLGYVWLDDAFEPKGEARLFDLKADNPTNTSRAEDARLLTVGEQLYMVYSDNPDPIISGGGFRVYVAELTVCGDSVEVVSSERLSQFEGESPKLREKSWVPFDYEGHLLLAYSLSPHKIFMPIFGQGKCETVALSETPLEWDWGIIRGGTPACLIDDVHYLAFYHSSIRMPSIHSDGKEITHYFIGAYLFSREPPFEITHISPDPIVGHGFYHGERYKHYWKPVRAVFPCGYIMDDEFIWMAYGRDDHELWIVKLETAALLRSLCKIGI